MRTLSILVAILMGLAGGCGRGGAPGEISEFILVANRDSGSLSVIDVKGNTVVRTVALPAGARPGYVVFSREHRRIYVGDDANARIIVIRADTYEHVLDLPMPADVFHMWIGGGLLWAVDRTDVSVAAFDLATNTRIAVVPIPADLRALGGVPHDIVADADHAFVTILDVSGEPDVVVKIGAVSFVEEGRAPVGEDPHVFLHPSDRRLFVACQDTDEVFVLDRDTMAEIMVVPILGGHGVWVPADGRTLYVTNFPGHLPGGGPGPGAVGLFAVDLDTHTAIGGTFAPHRSPHNITSTRDGRRLYVTHSDRGTKVTVYDTVPGAVPVLLGEIDVGDNPFGIAHFLP